MAEKTSRLSQEASGMRGEVAGFRAARLKGVLTPWA